jgi:uncharacterized membrane protein
MDKPFQGSTRYLQFNEICGVSEGAISFLRNTTNKSVIVAQQETSKVLGTLSAKPVAIMRKPNRGTLEYINKIYNMTKRYADVKQIYESCNMSQTLQSINDFGSRVYIYVGKNEQGYKICYDKFDKYFEKVNFGNDTIYYLRGVE